jgi:hypothetical protein
MATARSSGGGSGRSGGASRQLRAGDASDPNTDAPARGSGDEPDVLLDVPKLTVEEISLEVDNLHAQIALEARLADLVQLRVGADVEIERVALEIKGVEAQAQLKARLDNVLAIIERALDTVDNNPELLTELARSAQRAAGGLGEGVAKVGRGRRAARGRHRGGGRTARGGRGAGDRGVLRSPETPLTRERGRIGRRLEAPKAQPIAPVNAGEEPQAELAGAAGEKRTDESRPDVEIEASASAEALRALERPRTELSVKGGGDVREDDSSRRENLPRRLEPGATYRNIRVHRRLAGRLVTTEQDG